MKTTTTSKVDELREELISVLTKEIKSITSNRKLSKLEEVEYEIKKQLASYDNKIDPEEYKTIEKELLNNAIVTYTEAINDFFKNKNKSNFTHKLFNDIMTKLDSLNVEPVYYYKKELVLKFLNTCNNPSLLKEVHKISHISEEESVFIYEMYFDDGKIYYLTFDDEFLYSYKNLTVAKAEAYFLGSNFDKAHQTLINIENLITPKTNIK